MAELCQVHIDDLTVDRVSDFAVDARSTPGAGTDLKSATRMVRSSQRVVNPVNLIIICTQGLIGRDDENVSSTCSERPQELSVAFNGTLAYEPCPPTTVIYTDPDNIAFRPRSTSRKLPFESTCIPQETRRRVRCLVINSNSLRLRRGLQPWCCKEGIGGKS